jgi:hypothetical protein
MSVTFPAGVIEIVVEFTDTTTGGQATFVYTQTAHGAQTAPDGTLATNVDT